MAHSLLNFDNGARETIWSEEHERVPLKQRLKLLLASRRISFDSDIKLEAHNSSNLGTAVGGGDGNDSHKLQFSCHPEEQRIETVSTEEIYAGLLGVLINQENQINMCINPSQTVVVAAATSTQKVDSVDCNLCREPLFSPYPVKIKVESNGDCIEGTSGSLSCSAGAGFKSVNFEPDITIESLDKLDHVALKERLERLLTSKSLDLTAPYLEENSSGVLPLVSSTSHPSSDGTTNREHRVAVQRLSTNENQTHEIDLSQKSASSKSTMNSSCRSHQVVGHCSDGNKSISTGQGTQTDDHMKFPRKNISKYQSNNGKALISDDNKTVHCSSLQNISEVRVKVESPNYNGSQSPTAFTLGQIPFIVKTEVEIPTYFNKDEIDHMLLTERMKLLPSKENQGLNISQCSEYMKKRGPSVMGSTPDASKPGQYVKVNRRRKRQKTVTDSVETAMEEDAPGLLQVLIEKGVSVDEIKLYGEPESNEALDDSSADENFVELEEVIEKLFSQRDSFLKFGPIRCSRGEKASYCLECLFSLVEQARYLRFRNWPVEWGWCRDLQSFIFVFERHNRIVLERPEYGYATYFFELADSLPIDWQVKRLVTAMKLTSCSRITLLENKALMVGDDLTEGEAKVLMEYGWVPNTGLGTMLNYHDRVVHDRKNEKERSEWRSKIGKLLMDGYNGGTLVSADIPSKVLKYNVAHPAHIKLELD